MKISVVIPTLNEEKLLPLTLESLSQQTRVPDEIIIIDGGSTDKTVKIAQSYKTKIHMYPDLTISGARQKGLEYASGDVIVTTDADTIVPPHWLKKIEKAYEDPAVVTAYSSFTVSDGWIIYKFYVNSIFPFFMTMLRLFGTHISPGQNTSFRKQNAIEVGGYPIDFKAAEDIEIVRRLKKSGKILYVPDNLVTSSGRRGKEGWSWFPRMTIGIIKYLLFHKADTFSFKHFR